MSDIGKEKEKRTGSDRRSRKGSHDGAERRSNKRRKSDKDILKENVPSELDEMTHLEIGLLYDDTTRTIRFAKGIQWKAVSSSLLIFIVLIGLAKFITAAEPFINMLKIAIIFSAMASISLLLIFQFWQHAESQKITSMEALYSSAFSVIRKRKSKLEANIHRYIILLFMVSAVILGAYVTIVSINSFERPVSNQFQYKPLPN